MVQEAAPATATPARKFASFAEFYPFYLGEHSHPVCRRLHFVGSTLGLLQFAAYLALARYELLPLCLVTGYAFAWIGHFGFEKNRPATFKNPFYSFAGDWVMWKDIITGKIPF